MYIGNDFIESVALNREYVANPGYLGSYKRQLKTKYQDLLEESAVAPEFFVIHPMPKPTNALSNFSLS